MIFGATIISSWCHAIPKSVSFIAITEFRESSVSSFQPFVFVCQSELTKVLTETSDSDADLSEPFFRDRILETVIPLLPIEVPGEFYDRSFQACFACQRIISGYFWHLASQAENVQCFRWLKGMSGRIFDFRNCLTWKIFNQDKENLKRLRMCVWGCGNL